MDFKNINPGIGFSSELKNILDEIYLNKSDIYKIAKYLEKKEIFDTIKNYVSIDFDYNLFRKHINITKLFSNDEIIDFYFKNINRIKNIYSEKYFYLKYPDFILNEYKLFNRKLLSNIQIFNYYNGLSDSDKNNTVISISDFYLKNPSFNSVIYDGDIYTFYNLSEEERLSKVYSIQSFYLKYPDFNINIYKNYYEINHNDDVNIIVDFLKKIKTMEITNKNKDNIVYSVESFYKNNSDFDNDLYKLFNNNINSDEEGLINLIKNIKNKIYSINSFLKIYNDFNFNIYRSLNYQLKDFSDKELIIYWKNDINRDKSVYSIKTFYNIYSYYKLDLNNSLDANKIISYFKYDIYNENNKSNTGFNKKKIGRKYVSNINEVLIDLEQQKPKIEKGLSLIIRAKNEELNIKQCIESVVDLVDEIIFVDNGSTDKTFELMTDYEKKYNNIYLYKYDIRVSRVGIEHENALKNNEKNTLGTFYNWCLSKASKNIVFKWDADFICIRNNFTELVSLYNLKNCIDKIAVWFTGKTLFINNNSEYYLNYQSFYNEFRIFSYNNGFKWYDGNICEYTEPYLQTVKNNNKFVYHYPLFYEMKRTSINEFEERSSMIDNRDINDFNIINKLKNEIKDCNLIKINEKIINTQKKIIMITPSLTLGGGNQFILNIYYVLKTLGFKILICPMNYNKNEHIGKQIFNKIVSSDILKSELFNESFIFNYSPDIIFFNSVIPFQNFENFYEKINKGLDHKNKKKTKIYFVTHSDVAYSNYYIQKNYNLFDKIITVNNYTIYKLIKLLKININNNNNDKFFKIINYVEKKFIKKNIFKSNKKFGIISRFSEDKNIPMLLHALVEVFKKYNDYKFYLVGTHTESYDNYLKNIVSYLNIEDNICFEGFQNDTIKYYEQFDFIILPSVSEGCSYNIIEALNYGIPVVASHVGGNHELIKNEECGILYNYNGIRELEMKKVYIENYNEHLDNIGYFINNKEFKANYTILNNFSKFSSLLEVISPIFINNNELNINLDQLNTKIGVWNENKENIEKSIIQMIESPYTQIYKYVRNNNNFIENEFNENIYINQVIELFF